MTLLTPDDMAKRLAVTRDRIIALARGEGLPHVRIGKLYRFPEAEVDAWIAERVAYTPAGGEAEGARQRTGLGVRSPGPSKAVVRRHGRRLDAGRPSDPPGPLRIVRTGGEEPAR